MTKIQGQVFGDQVMLPRTHLDRLVELARNSDAIDLELFEGETTARDILTMAEHGRAFDFWHEAGEEVYSPNDGEPV